MSLKDFLKSTGLIEEVADQETPIQQTVEKKPTSLAGQPAKSKAVNEQSTPVSVTPSTLTTNTGSVVQNYVDHFNQVLEELKSKNPDADYLTFKKSFENTSSSQGSVMENLRYQITFGALQSIGLTKEKLLSSSKIYLDGLAADNKEYMDNSNSKKDNEVNTRETKITDLNKEIETKNALIQTLLKEIQDDSTTVATLKNEVIEQTNIIDQKQKNFSTTYDSVVTQIQNDVNKIQQYLQ